MKTTTTILLASLLLLGGCPGSDVVDADGTEGSSGSSGTGGSSGSSGSGTTTTAVTSSSTTDASVDDTGTDTGQPQPPIPQATVIMQTAGGGRVSSTSHSARIRIGAPQPVGHAMSPQHHLHLGPGSVQ